MDNQQRMEEIQNHFSSLSQTDLKAKLIKAGKGAIEPAEKKAFYCVTLMTIQKNNMFKLVNREDLENSDTRRDAVCLNYY